MSLSALIPTVFASDGPLARAQPSLRERPAQTAMAQAVAETITARQHLVVEAGTGIGKTFAYLVPALLSGERVLVSTATKNLQDQLYDRDLPLLLRALALPRRVARLKGRANYLCRQRLDRARQGEDALGETIAFDLARIEQWAQATSTGDLSELSALTERSAVWSKVTSTVDNCPGGECPRFRDCHVYQARRDALSADVVVINHHLFFADLGGQDAGAAPLLPLTGVVIFDEAHSLTETAAQFLGQQLAMSQLLQLGQDVMEAGIRYACGAADWRGLRQWLSRAADSLRQVAVQEGLASGLGDASQRRIPWTGDAPSLADAANWSRAMQEVVRALRGVLGALDGLTGRATEFAHLHERTVALLGRALHFCSAGEGDVIRWLEVAGTLRLVETPLNMAAMLAKVWGRPGVVEGAWDEEDEIAPGPDARSWVFTSATLGDGRDLHWFTDACGLQGVRTLQVDSPFDYVQQSALYVPEQLPLPADSCHSRQLAQWLGDAVARLGGRTLVLTTSLRAQWEIASELCRRFPPGCGIEVLVQGQASRSRMVERFRAQVDACGRPVGYVLVGASSFWEGIDVPGDALQLVVIDKLPFPAPDDPWEQGRALRLVRQGRSAFREHSLPAAAVALKQGAGRLIRSESDRGVLVIGDTRLLKKGYGKRLLRALPPMRPLQTQEEFEEVLAALTRTSTRDCLSP